MSGRFSTGVVRAARSTLSCGIVGALLAVPGTAGADHLPAWLEPRLASVPDVGDAHAVYLLRERRLVSRAHGATSVRERGAVRVLDPSGSRWAAASVSYCRGTDALRSFRAWVVKSPGDVEQLGEHDATDVSVGGPLTLESDVRARVLAARDAPPGTVFAWESEIDQDPLLAQWEWSFTQELPVARSRFVLVLPEGFVADAHAWPADSIRVRREGSDLVWERRDVPARTVEPLQSGTYAAREWLAVSAHTTQSGLSVGREFESWHAVAAWSADLAAHQIETTPELRERALQLARGLENPMERAAAIGRFVQGLNYVAVELGLGRGEGYRPRAAAEVLRAGYGDCKDKANLMRALLAIVGQEAWLVPVFSSDRERVREPWPSPLQFNHCIIAIRAPEAFRSGPILESSPLGRVFLFDPTDPATAFGDLPRDEQGSLALIADAVRGDLVRLPTLPAEANQVTRNVRVALRDDGGLDGRLEELCQGQAEAVQYAAYARGAAAYQRGLESWIAASLGPTKVDSVAVLARPESGTIEVRAHFTTPAFAQRVGEAMMTFRPALLTPRDQEMPEDSTRRTPIALPGTAMHESVEISLPAGWTVDELPPKISLRSDVYTVEAECTNASDRIVFRRSWHTQPCVLPADRYPDVHPFFAALARSGQAPVVLVQRVR